MGVKEQGIKPIDAKLDCYYWVFLKNQPTNIRIIKIDISDAQRANLTFCCDEGKQHTFCVNPTGYNNWGYEGLVPLFTTKNDCMDYEISKLQNLKD
jgi:hypothetical protein